MSEQTTKDGADLENKFCAADQFRANSELNTSEYSIPVLALIFLRFADARFRRLLELPEGMDIGNEINKVMKTTEEENFEIPCVFSRTCKGLETVSVTRRKDEVHEWESRQA